MHAVRRPARRSRAKTGETWRAAACRAMTGGAGGSTRVLREHASPAGALLRGSRRFALPPDGLRSPAARCAKLSLAARRPISSVSLPYLAMLVAVRSRARARVRAAARALERLDQTEWRPTLLQPAPDLDRIGFHRLCRAGDSVAIDPRRGVGSRLVDRADARALPLLDEPRVRARRPLARLPDRALHAGVPAARRGAAVRRSAASDRGVGHRRGGRGDVARAPGCRGGA